MRPEGTRTYLGPEARAREALLSRLLALFAAWGYEPVELSALEPFDPAHPNAESAFKLVDKTGDVLMLRSEFTTALMRALAEEGALSGVARYRYAGPLWLREAPAELGRLREFTQVGVELVGLSSPAADAELLSLAWEALEVAGVRDAVLELGLPSFVRDLLEAARLDPEATERLRRAVDKKAVPELTELLDAYGVKGRVREAILALPDLYGGREVLAEARRHALSERAKLDLDWLEETLDRLPAGVELLFDLGMARRFDYYSGLTFRAFSPAHGFPLLGGGRYDGARVPFAAGFALGLERLIEAGGQVPEAPARYLAASPEVARRLRAEGKVAILGHGTDEEALLAEARQVGARYVAFEDRVLEVEG